MSQQRELPQAVIEALMRGDKIGAVKLIREAGGVDLRTAMDLIQSQIAQGRNMQSEHMRSKNHRAHDAHAPRMQTDRVPDAVDADAHTDARVRANVAMSKARTPTVMPGDSPAGGLGWLWMAGAALLAWWWLGGQAQ